MADQVDIEHQNNCNDFNSAANQPRDPDYNAKNIIIEVVCKTELGTMRSVTGTIFYLPDDGNDDDAKKALQEGTKITVYTHTPLDEIRDSISFNQLEIYKPTISGCKLSGIDPRPACMVPMTKQFNQHAYATISPKYSQNTKSPCQSCSCKDVMPKFVKGKSTFTGVF